MIRAFLYAFAVVAFIGIVLNVPADAGWRRKCNKQLRNQCSGSSQTVRTTTRVRGCPCVNCTCPAGACPAACAPGFAPGDGATKVELE